MTRTLLLIAAAALLPTQVQAESRAPASLTRAEVRAGNFQLVSSHCAEGLCERVYERTVQPIRRSRAVPQRYIVRIEPDARSRSMAFADR